LHCRALARQIWRKFIIVSSTKTTFRPIIARFVSRATQIQNITDKQKFQKDPEKFDEKFNK